MKARTRLAPVEPWNEGLARFHSPHVFGCRVAQSMILPLAVAGERPLRLRVECLPAGLVLDESSMAIRGSTAESCCVNVRVTARNAHGEASHVIRIDSSQGLALTPPRGWNSWNLWGADIDEAKIKGVADQMVSSGLVAHGYHFLTLDDGWQGGRANARSPLQPNQRFSAFNQLGTYLHDRGLKFGLYSTPWVSSYAGLSGGSAACDATIADTHWSADGQYVGYPTFERVDAKQWAMWEVDLVKYDWYPIDVRSVSRISDALRESGRDIILSLSNSTPYRLAETVSRQAELWRTTGDIRDSSAHIRHILEQQDAWTGFAGPGHWNDPDMLVIGQLSRNDGFGGGQLTQDEQILHVTTWVLLAAPLFLGCDVGALEDFHFRLLCNPEVLAIHQDSLGKQAYRLRRSFTFEPELVHPRELDGVFKHATNNLLHIYVRELMDGSLAIGLVNWGDEAAEVWVTWHELQIHGPRRVRDVWAREDMGIHKDRVGLPVPSHGAQFIKLSMPSLNGG